MNASEILPDEGFQKPVSSCNLYAWYQAKWSQWHLLFWASSRWQQFNTFRSFRAKNTRKFYVGRELWRQWTSLNLHSIAVRGRRHRWNRLVDTARSLARTSVGWQARGRPLPCHGDCRGCRGFSCEFLHCLPEDRRGSKSDRCKEEARPFQKPVNFPSRQQRYRHNADRSLR